MTTRCRDERMSARTADVKQDWQYWAQDEMVYLGKTELEIVPGQPIDGSNSFQDSLKVLWFFYRYATK